MQKQITLIRHGETDWNLQKRYMGHADIKLNARGISQAEELRRRLNGKRFKKIYSSPSSRAFQFASIIFGKDVCIEKLEQFKEIDFGIFEGFRYEKLMERYADLYRNWVKDPYSVAIPDGEKMSDFRSRVLEGFKMVSALGYESAAIVTHGGPISIIINELKKKSDFWGSIPPPSGIVTIFRDTENGEWAIDG